MIRNIKTVHYQEPATRLMPSNVSTASVRQASEFLSFRSFYTGHEPSPVQRPKVSTFLQLSDAIKFEIGQTERPAIFLSSGMDSAVLAPFMPKGSIAYTIYQPGIERTEVALAKRYAEKYDLVHKVIEMDVDQYFEVINGLMVAKKMPLSPAEPVLHILALQAAEDGHTHVVTGAGADTTQGGFPHFRKRRGQGGFQKRLQRAYLNPKEILKDSSDISHVICNYMTPGALRNIVNSQAFLKEIGTERFAFDNATSHAGVKLISPFSLYDCPFDQKKNSRRPKHYIQEFYRHLYGELPPKKFGLQKPSLALKTYRPERDEFRQDFDYEGLNYNKRFLVYTLERFMNEVGFSN